METRPDQASEPPIDTPTAQARGGEDALTFLDTSSEVLMRLIQVVMVVLVVAWTLIIVSGNSTFIVSGVTSGVTLLTLCYLDFKARRVERGMLLLCWGLWLYAAVYGVLVAGIRTPVLVILPCLVMITAWLRGKRNLVLMTVFSVIYLIVLTVADVNKWLPTPVPRTTVQIAIVYVGIVVISSVVALMIAENFRRLIARSLNLSNELSIRVEELNTSDGALRELNERLEQRVVERTAQFDDANKSLQKTIAKLELAQAELVNSEKLASLGSMVAGISHELNTPIGNVLTLTTGMETRYQEILQQLEDGRMRKSALQEFLQTGYEISVLTTRSTQRAVELVSSFKQVAVDQTSEQRRNFSLRVVVDDNIASLWPSIKSRRDTINIDNQVPESLTCDSYPGPLGQVLVNLTQNAILHGLADSEHGQIVISAEEHGQTIHVHVSDNGVGMTPTVMAHVFDPFFTTKLGKGGSGLGLSVSYRIVTSVLAGTISVVSSPGQGARFTLTFPKTAPFKL